MAKIGEKEYFKKIGKEGVEHSLKKPFSNGVTIGGLLHDIAAVYSLFPEHTTPKKILDLGCGTGWTSNFYAQSGHDVVGVDIAKEAIAAAKKHFKGLSNLKFVCSDYDKLPYKNEFDIAIFFDALHHSVDERDGLRAAFKALKPGGKIIICEPGLGHSKNPVSIHAVKTYGVNERDMPPKLSRKQLSAVGFVRLKTYAYPAMVHRALYNESNKGLTKILRSSSLLRGLTVGLLSTAAKPWHGIVTAIKPVQE